MSSRFKAVLLSAIFLAAVAVSAAPRFVVDDDDYVQKITDGSASLLKAGKLVSLAALRSEVRSRGAAVALAPVAHQDLPAPDLCDRLRESTLAIGTYYKCPDCGLWHFNSSTGFAVGPDGVICTCCHVVMTEDPDVKESYLVAGDAQGHVYPVKSVVAADTEADTCLLKIEAAGLKPLPMRPGVRPGERVYCLSHPGGYFFMFTQGMVARLNRRQNDVYDEFGKTNGLLTRPVLFLNVTAEFAPGSSGAPLVDQAGNVVAQVASIADAGEPPEGSDTNSLPSPSVPVRFCTAAEEILKLTDASVARNPQPKVRKQKVVARHPEAVEKK